ncbi:MAG: VirB3 family type IV secretion system protein [Leptospirales bacterium]
MASREIPIHQSLVKPLLLAGGDRELVLMNIVGQAGALFMMGLSVFSISLVLIVGGVLHVALVIMGKKDPLMREAWMAYRAFRIFYPARSECRVNPPKIRRGL